MFRRLLPGILVLLLVSFLPSCSDDDTSGPGSGLSMDEAIDIVIDEVLPEEVPAGGSYVCVRMSGSLAAGTTIEEAAPEGWRGAGQRSSAVSMALAKESYFFYLDLAPRTLYQHPVKYIVVERESGDYSSTEAAWWPKINGTAPSHLLQEVPEAELIVSSNVNMQVAEGAEMVFDLPILATQLEEGFIVIQGLMSNEACFSDATATYVNGVNFFNSYKNAFSSLEGLVQGQADNVFTEIDQMVTEGKYLITIYIIAHGGIDGISLGGYWITAVQFHDKFEEYPDVLFNLLLGSCHSGSFINNFTFLSNVRVIATACAADEGASPDRDAWGLTIDYNLSDSGSEWTSSILAAAASIVDNSTYWSILVDNAGYHGVPVTCELLCAARYGAVGANPGFGLSDNIDLTSRVGHTTPQGYCSWESPF